VDNALVLLQLMRDEGSIRLKQAANALGVAPSTAHRLLAMLIYRGFAVQDESKLYVPGPAMSAGPAGVPWTLDFRLRAMPHIRGLSESLDESVNLAIRVGRHVRFVSSVEGRRLLRVGNRKGMVLPAWEASGGKAMLAEMPRTEIDELFRSKAAEADGFRRSDVDYARFIRMLSRVRREGFGVNSEETEEGVSAIGVTVHCDAGFVLGAICVAVPTSRYKRQLSEGLIEKTLRFRDDLESDLADFPVKSDSA